MTKFLETEDGDLINAAEIFRIYEYNGNVFATLRTRSEDDVQLKHSMEETKHLLSDVIPAAPGFYVIKLRELTYAIIGWRKTNYGWEPVTVCPRINRILAKEEDHYGIMSPDQRIVPVEPTGYLIVFPEIDEWRKWTEMTLEIEEKEAKEREQQDATE